MCKKKPASKSSQISSNRSFSIPKEKRDYFVRKIREWGRENYVHYPWRAEDNIFIILLTEILLQQTDSQKIKKFYPLIKSFTSPREVLKNRDTLDHIISKIGLNYRKERILYLSRQILEEFKGKMPTEYKKLRQLKGVGDYIANAVLLFGFNKRAAIVDTNTISIIESFFGCRSPLKRPREDRGLNEILLGMLPLKKYAVFSYYLLDFGAAVCVKSKNKCGKCLLKRRCHYYIISSHGI
ncbi:MAG: hypothetical protein KAW12_02925 [Candidatus Aminicenantes bacterium]|nr:hypothetical protein [Candidatus Aminicenantes bacterium]